MVDRTNASELMDVEKQAELRERIRQGKGKIKGGVWGHRIKRSDNLREEGDTGVGGEGQTGTPIRINRSKEPKTQGGNSGSAGERKSRSLSPSLTRSFENWDTKRKDWNTDSGVGSRELTGSRAREVEARPSARGNRREGSKTQDERKGEDENRRSRSPSHLQRDTLRSWAR